MLMTYRTSFKDGYLNLEIPNKDQIYLFNKMIEFIHEKSSHISTATMNEQIVSIFRISRMAYDVMTNSRISNMSYEDLVLLLVFAHACENFGSHEFIKILQSNKYSLTKDGDNYPIVANDAAKSVAIVINS